MKKRIFRITICIIAVIVCACALAGCTKYNAKMDSSAKQYISEDFLKENRVGNAWYLNEDYVEGVSDWETKYYYDETSPKERIFIINEKEEFNKIFTKYSKNINFDKKMVILRIYSTHATGDSYNIVDIEIEDKVLTICYDDDLRSIFFGGSVESYQRCFMVVLDKKEITSAQFIKNNR